MTERAERAERAKALDTAWDHYAVKHGISTVRPTPDFEMGFIYGWEAHHEWLVPVWGRQWGRQWWRRLLYALLAR